MLRQFSTRRIIASFLFDWLGTIGMLILAAYLRVQIGFLPQPLLTLLEGLQIPVTNWWEGMRPEDVFALPIIIIISIIWPFFFSVFSVYDGRRNESPKAELLNVFMATAASILALSGVLFLTYRETSRGLFFIFFLLDLGFLLGWRIAWYVYRANKNGKQGVGRYPVLVVGAGLIGQKIAAELHKYAGRDISVVGYVDDNPQKQGQNITNLPVLGTLDQVLDVVRDYNVCHAVIALPSRAHERLIEVSQTLQGAAVRVHIIPDLFTLSFPSATLDGFGGIPVIDLGMSGIQRNQRVVKRVFDVLAVTFVLALLSPILLVVAILIKLDSTGPVFYKGKRIGEGGQPFTMYKFRSMALDADSNIHQDYVTRLIRENIRPQALNGERRGTLKMEQDARITRVGRFIRKTSLDELPQLFNVLRGEMSLVGPRPPLPYEVEVYQEWHKRRFEAPPGITGLWQVKARNQVSFDEMVRLDLEYIEKYSVWLDIKLILQTPWELVKGRGAG